MRTLIPTWGQSLRLAVSEYKRGMNGITDVIRFASPRNAVSRAKLSEFYDIENAAELNDGDKFLAWMISTPRIVRHVLNRWCRLWGRGGVTDAG